MSQPVGDVAEPVGDLPERLDTQESPVSLAPVLVPLDRQQRVELEIPNVVLELVGLTVETRRGTLTARDAFALLTSASVPRPSASPRLCRV